MSDFECLQSYARENSQAAFAALVARHVDLVYSAALRQVRSPELAEEVAQSVFLDLSRHAAKIAADQPLAAWLYVVTRRTAVDVIRRESRRQTRERTAAEFAAMKETPPHAWPHVERSLDEAMDTLNDTERSAIVLRFFENHSLREVGAALGISEDTAQKRVSRALDQLRTFFARRGVAVTATGLATELSAHAIQAAPVGLGATISTAAALSGGAGAAATLEVTKTIAMTTIQKSLLTAAFVVVAGAGFYEARALVRQQSDSDAFQRGSTTLSAQLHEAQAQQDLAASRLKSVEEQIDARLAKPATIATAGDTALEDQMKTWLEKLDRLKQLSEQRPALAIPDLKLLNDDSWFNVATNAKLDSEEGIRLAFADLRHRAQNSMASRLSQALAAYIKANDGMLPDNVAQLLPFTKPSLDPSLLERYAMLRTGKLSDVPGSDRMGIIAAAPVDVEYDAYWRIGANSYGNESAMSYNVMQANRAFAAAHSGTRTRNAGDLFPYLKWPVDEAVLQKFLAPDAGK